MQSPPTIVRSDGAWQRVHWATPLLRSWQLLVVGAALVFSSFANSAGEGDWATELAQQGVHHLTLVRVLVILAGLLLLAGLAVGWLFFAWTRTEYRITAESLELHAGVVFQKHRSARLDRLQSVTISQPFLARIAGLSRLRLEVAGGQGSNVSLEFLREDDAQQLRNHLLARAAGIEYDTPDAPEAVSSEVTSVPISRLIWSIVFSEAVLVFLVSVSIAAGAIVATGSLVGFVAVLSAVFASGGAMWRRFTNGFDFRLGIAQDGLRLSYGLLEKRTQTVAPGRVQALEVKQPLLWRAFGWWRIEVNVAGNAAGDSDSDPTNLMLPVGKIEDVRVVLPLLVPYLLQETAPVDIILEGLVGSGEGSGFTTSPRRARRLDPLQWRRTGFRSLEQALLIRHGRLARGFVVVPHERTQSLGLYQGPILRRLDLATVGVHSTPGPIRPRATRLDTVAAAALVTEQAARARRARAAARPERWMERPSSQAASDALQQPAETPEGPGVD